jgi:hypothetical protein
MLRLRLGLRLLYAPVEQGVHCGRRYFRIAGQGPRVKWKRNADGHRRSIDEALEIARRNGVEVPEDVVFFVAEPGELNGTSGGLLSGQTLESARGPTVSEHEDGRIRWEDHYNRYGKVPFQIHPDVLTSDEAIVAVFQHEMHELSLLRRVFTLSKNRCMVATDIGTRSRQVDLANFTISRGMKPINWSCV